VCEADPGAESRKERQLVYLGKAMQGSASTRGIGWKRRSDQNVGEEEDEDDTRAFDNEGEGDDTCSSPPGKKPHRVVDMCM